MRAAVLETVFTADTRPLERGHQKARQEQDRTTKAADQASSRFSRGYSRMSAAAQGLGGTLTSIGVGAILKNTADEASHLGEVVSFTDQVFKRNSAEMQAWGATTLDSIGAAKVTALEAANGFGVLFNAADLTLDQSGELSQAMVKLAADMSSAKDVPLEESLTAIRSGLVGESEPLRRFGILLNEAAVQEEALRLGLVKQGQELTEAAKTQARVSLITQEGAVYNDNYADTAESMANQQRRASEAAKEASASLGDSLAPIMATVYGLGADVAGVFASMPGPVRTATIALLGLAAASPILFRVADGAKLLWTNLGGLAGLKGRLVGLAFAMQNLGAGIAPNAGSLAQMGAGMAATAGITAAATVAVYAWSKALGEASKAQKLQHENIMAGAKFIDAYGKATEAGVHTREELIATIKRQIAVGVEEGANTEELTALRDAGRKALDRYDAAHKRTMLRQIDGVTEATTVTVKSLKRQWRFLDMNLQEYEEWAAGTRGALNGVQGKLGDLAGKAKLTARQITRAFDRQLDQQKDYAKDWGAVLDRGLAKKAPELVQQLQEMGLEGAGIVGALADANREDFGKIIGQWNEAQEISDRTSRAVVRHTNTWKDEQAAAMDVAASAIGDVNTELAELKSLAGTMAVVDVNVRDNRTGGPSVAGSFGSASKMGSQLLAMFPGLQQTSGYREGDDGFHGDARNPAVDLAMGSWPSDTSGIFDASAWRVFQTAVGLFGANIREAIYGNWIYERGRMGFYGANDHWGHVHLADRGLIAKGRTLIAQGDITEAHIPLSTGQGRRELARAFAAAGAGRGGSFTGTVRIVNLEEAVLELVDDGVDGLQRHRARRNRAGAN